MIQVFKVLVEENDTRLNGCDMITVIAPDFFFRSRFNRFVF